MPDVTYSLSVNVAKGPLTQNFFAANKTFDLATSGLLSVTLNVGTATSSLTTASASNLGYCIARSLVSDTTGTATVTFGRLDGTTLHETVRLRPGDVAWLRLAAGDYGARAAVADSRLLVQILED